jgi:hypothetical protein
MFVQQMFLHYCAYVILLHMAFLRFCCGLGVLHRFNLGKGTCVTNEAFHHFHCLQVNYRNQVVYDKECLNNVGMMP